MAWESGHGSGIARALGVAHPASEAPRVEPEPTREESAPGEAPRVEPPPAAPISWDLTALTGEKAARPDDAAGDPAARRSG